MTTRRVGTQAKGGDEVQGLTALESKLEVTNRLLAILVARADPKQAIAVLSSVGFQPAQIASAVGMSPNAVRVALHRIRKAAAGATIESSGADDPAE